MGRFLTGGVLLIAFILASSISTATCCNPNKVFANKLHQSLVRTLKFDILFVNLQVVDFYLIKGNVGDKSQRTGSEKHGVGD